MFAETQSLREVLRLNENPFIGKQTYKQNLSFYPIKIDFRTKKIYQIWAISQILLLEWWWTQRRFLIQSKFPFRLSKR